MTLYQIIYDWFGDLLDGCNLTTVSFTIGGQVIDMVTWLQHTGTFIVLILCCVFLVNCVIWLFKFFGGLFKW